MNHGASHKPVLGRVRSPYAHDLMDAEVLTYLRAFHALNDNLPTLGILCRHFRWRSVSTAARYMRSLEARGQLEAVPGMKAWRFARPAAPRLQ